MSHSLETARSMARFLAAETGLVFKEPSLDEERRAVLLPFESVAGCRHVVAFAEELLTDYSDEEIQETLRAHWLPAHLMHPAYQPLLVTKEGVGDL